MKQNISVDQLNELSDKGRKRLREWWKPEEGDLYSHELVKYWHEVFDAPKFVHVYSACEFCKCELESWPDKQDNTPLLSIGQMIEFLEDHDIQYKITDHLLSIFKNKYMRFEGRALDIPLFNPLVDALWQAVKEVLESES